MASYLISNIGDCVTATTETIAFNWSSKHNPELVLQHPELSYLVSFLPMFSCSPKAQLINPRKVYAIDLVLVDVISNTLTEDGGRKLEDFLF